MHRQSVYSGCVKLWLQTAEKSLPVTFEVQNGATARGGEEVMAQQRAWQGTRPHSILILTQFLTKS